MNAQDLIVVFTSVFIVGMIWLRTRMQYMRRGAGPLQLAPPGRAYFGAVVVLLVIGFFAAPLIGAAFWPNTGITPTITRVIWGLVTYYIFILIHRVLKARGTQVFTHSQAFADGRPSTDGKVLENRQPFTNGQRSKDE
jgi:hypothetical protein